MIISAGSLHLNLLLHGQAIQSVPYSDTHADIQLQSKAYF